MGFDTMEINLVVVVFVVVASAVVVVGLVVGLVVDVVAVVVVVVVVASVVFGQYTGQRVFFLYHTRLLQFVFHVCSHFFLEGCFEIFQFFDGTITVRNTKF